MQIPEDSNHHASNPSVDQWAHLEGKSECMADDLTHQVEPADATLSVKARLLGFCIVLFVAAVIVLSVVFSVPTPNDSKKVDTPQKHQRAYP